MQINFSDFTVKICHDGKICYINFPFTQFLGLVAGWPKQKAGGRMLLLAGFAGQAGLCWWSPATAKSGTGRGSGGTGRGHPATEANFLYFKHDLPHDVG